MVRVQRRYVDHDLKLHVVVYMGGCCGDLVTALIDHNDAGLNVAAQAVTLPKQRQRLKKPHLFVDAAAMDHYVEEMSSLYQSVPSHAVEYHVARGHRFIGIAVETRESAIWAARRFKKIHRDEVWQSVTQRCSIDGVEQYAQLLLDYSNMISDVASDVISLEHIRSGQAISAVENIVGRRLVSDSLDFYRAWSEMQHSVSVC